MRPSGCRLSHGRSDVTTATRRRWWLEPLILLALFGAALFVRTYGLHTFPPGLYNDEAANGVDAVAVIDGARPVFFPRNTGREPLFIYLQAGLIALVGQTPFALRLAAALLGALTVPAAYLMVRTAFADTRHVRSLSLWTALFLTVGYWHVSLSRIAFRAIALPFYATATFALFWWSWRRTLGPGRQPWLGLVLTGALLGVTLYTYTAARFVPVVMALLMLVTLAQQWHHAEVRNRVLWASLVIIGASAVVFAPLGLYFLAHPDAFFGRALSVSVLNEGYSGGNPVGALAWAAWETAKMFVVTGDANLRHNPAQRPLFDVLLGAWLAAGIVLAAVRIRRLPYLFVLAWFLLLALPAIVTAEGIPHSLRAVGMMPVAYLLPVLAMVAVGEWLSRRFEWRAVAAWLPLPFFLVSAAVTLTAYFGLMAQPERLRAPFLADYVEMADELAAFGTPADTWIIPLSANYHLADARFYTIDYTYTGAAGEEAMLVDPATVGTRLAEAVAGRDEIYLLRTQDSVDYVEASYILGDPKNLLKFLLDKYGKYVGKQENAIGDLGYLIYTMPPQDEFPVYDELAPVAANFDNRLRLTGVDYGPTAGDRADGSDVNAADVPSGDALWVALAWEALAPVDTDLKTNLVVVDADGHVVARADDLLVGDRYPVERVWEPGEPAMSYHILPMLSGTPPGAYELRLRVYEDASLRPYPLVDDQGRVAGLDLPVGTVAVAPPVVPAQLTPTHALNVPLGDGLTLLGHEEIAPSVAPGATLNVTLLWHADASPTADHAVTAELRDASGEPVAAQTRLPAGDAYPPTAWRAGESLFGRHDLTVPPTADNGMYELVLVMDGGSAQPVEVSLGPVEVNGRPRIFTAPELASVMPASFGQAVALLGAADPLPATFAPGATLDLALVWQVLAPPGNALVRFVHLLGPDGVPVAQLDSAPCNGECPSESWLADEILLDTLSLTLPADLAPGDYRLAVGWYDPNTLARLPAQDEAGAPLANDVVVLPDGSVGNN